MLFTPEEIDKLMTIVTNGLSRLKQDPKACAKKVKKNKIWNPTNHPTEK